MMIASAISAPLDARSVGTPVQPGPNGLLLSIDKEQLARLSGHFDDFCRLYLAATEQRLWTLLDTNAIHLIIINTTPANVIDGIRLCSQLKSAPYSAHLPVIVLIPGNDPKQNIACLTAGADACLEKPVSGEYLRAQVRNLLGNRHRVKSFLSQPLLSDQQSAASGENQAFVKRLNEYILANLHHCELTVNSLAAMMNISRPTLYRKIRNVSTHTPNGLLNAIRLTRAAELLAAGEYKVFEIAQRVGFRSRSNFGKAFQKQFGITPREYSQNTRKPGVLSNQLQS